MQYIKCVSAIIVASVWHGQASADMDADLVGKNWGCTVKMCKMNPKGETDEPKCRPAIKKFHDEMAKGHPQYPQCDDGSKEDGNTYNVSDYYDPCPDGTAAAPAGSTVVTGARTDSGTLTITSVAKKSEVQVAEYLPPSERACVGAPVGMMQAVGGQYDEGTMLMVYSSVAWQKAYLSPRAMDVYGADGKFVKRVRL